MISTGWWARDHWNTARRGNYNSGEDFSSSSTESLRFTFNEDDFR